MCMLNFIYDLLPSRVIFQKGDESHTNYKIHWDDSMKLYNIICEMNSWHQVMVALLGFKVT